ncbi:hypothetical protein F2Q70_00004344 [Brassica cretica]|uniref:Uncharacterized protein n=1 Tax=Brassica cretica TaxID=69181 RepID=A0A3N6Q8R9_BRACR|nr:hypothetical protein F2Q70_00004344 [Brassica cretica]KAF3561662.1 hypothetical protein DY000_02016314 [Brassica cretica]
MESSPLSPTISNFSVLRLFPPLYLQVSSIAESPLLVAAKCVSEEPTTQLDLLRPSPRSEQERLSLVLWVHLLFQGGCEIVLVKLRSNVGIDEVPHRVSF